MSDTDHLAFEEFGILEVMGRLKMAGKISEQTIAGTGFIRIDVPETKRAPAFTRFFSPGSIYSITPTTEAIARSLAESWREEPITRFDLPQLEAPKAGVPGITGEHFTKEDFGEEDWEEKRHDDPDF